MQEIPLPLTDYVEKIRPMILKGLETMTKGILGKKIGMTQLFDVNGKFIPVSVVEAGPCSVTQLKTVENDGYDAVQLGFGDIKPTKANKPQKGHFEKAGSGVKRHLQEFKFEDISDFKPHTVKEKDGDGKEIEKDATVKLIKADTFEVGDMVDVSGVSKGKGFQGTIKRYNNRRIKETHGSGPVHRHAGSMGACSSPSRIFKGKKMPGHMGVENVTIQNLEIVKVDVENNLIAIKGAIPGPNGGIVRIVNNVKGKQRKGEPAQIINHNKPQENE